MINHRAFILGFIGVFALVTLQLAGGRPVFKNPFADSREVRVNVFDKIIKPKLERIKNEYSVDTKKTYSLVSVAQADSSLNDASAYAVIDFETGEVLSEERLDYKLPIASLTKIMTAVVTLDLAQEDEYFTVSYTAASQIPTKIGVVPGQELNVKELLQALLLTSANDAAQVLQEGVDKKYNEEVFIRAMNAKAEFLGLENTYFQNPQGFDEYKHYSSVRDLAILSHYALTNYPLIREIVKEPYVYLPEESRHKQFDLYNWNGLVGVYPGTTGIKIGNTEAAGKTTVVVSERNGKKLIAVVLGAPGLYERDLWAAELLDIGFKEISGLEPVNLTKRDLQEKYDSWVY